MMRGVTLALMLAASTLAAPKRPSHQKPAYTEEDKLKNWALARCVGKMAKAYGSDPVMNDAFDTAAGYLELGSSPVEVFNRIDSLVDEYLAVPYGSRSKSNLDTMKCIDLFHSKELRALVSEETRRRRRD
jgi:hypothetical protein